MTLLSILLCIPMPLLHGKLLHKTEVIQNQFSSLRAKNPDLHDIVQDTAEYVSAELNMDLVLTEVYRSDASQRRLYPDDPDRVSPHQLWSAVDIRTRLYRAEQVRQIVRFINSKYAKSNEYAMTAFYHDIGWGSHIHIQYKRKNDVN